MPAGWVLTESEAKQPNMRKLTKKEIQEGLELIPMDRLLLGNSQEVRLTAKQKRFAEELARGNTKSGAYRAAYNTKSKPANQASDAQKIAKNPHIIELANRITLALEAAKYQTPAHIRALTIHELTKHAISDETAPAQRIKALELLGKITEVALFTERRETVVTTDSTAARAKLMAAMKLAINNSNAIEAEYTSADDLLAELAGSVSSDDDTAANEEQATEPAADEEPASPADAEPTPAGAGGSQNENAATPPTPAPKFKGNAHLSHLHSIPHIQSAQNLHNSAITEDVVSENTGFDQIIDDFDENI
jgi:phage terminase small subunit